MHFVIRSWSFLMSYQNIFESFFTDRTPQPHNLTYQQVIRALLANRYVIYVLIAVLHNSVSTKVCTHLPSQPTKGILTLANYIWIQKTPLVRDNVSIFNSINGIMVLYSWHVIMHCLLNIISFNSTPFIVPWSHTNSYDPFFDLFALL